MIVAGLETQDSAFFSIESTDITLRQKILDEDIISFTYDEENGRTSVGSLVLNDPNFYYSKCFRMGARLNVSFGYMSPDASINAAILATRNPKQIYGGLARTGISTYIGNLSGRAESNGRITFNCNFYGLERLAVTQHRSHIGITKMTLVQLLLTELGIVSSYVNFTRGAEILNRNTQITQRETNYRLLLRLAREWRCIFRISNTPAGTMSATFISPQYIGQQPIGALMSGVIAGDSIFLEYKEGVSNVIEYNWKNNQGASGSGDNVRIVYQNGRPTFMRYVASTDRVRAYIFRPERVEARLRAAGSFTDGFALIRQYYNVRDFEEIRWAFDPVDLSTAPQGLGYSMNVKMLGIPLMSAPLKVLFGEGFPYWCYPVNPNTHLVKFYARKVIHTIDKDGYKMDLDIADGFTITGGSLL